MTEHSGARMPVYVLAAALYHDSCFVVGSRLHRPYVSIDLVYY